MKRTYRGHLIDCHRGISCGGQRLLYFSVFRLSDKREIISNFTYGEDTVKDYMRYMRERINGYIIDPYEEFPDATEEEIKQHRKQLKSLR